MSADMAKSDQFSHLCYIISVVHVTVNGFSKMNVPLHLVTRLSLQVWGWQIQA